MSCLAAHADGLIQAFKIAPGAYEMVDVTIPNATGMTALQFDVTVPQGLILSKVSRSDNTEDRKIEYAEVGTNKYRILTYSMKNATFEDANNVLFMGFEAASDAETGEKEVEVDGIVIVDPEGNATEPAGEKVAVAIQGDENITIGSSGMTTFVSKSGLDFTDNEMKAYVVTGIEGKSIWMTRVYKVPAGTPVVVKGTEGSHPVTTEDVSNLYYESFLIGNNTDEAINVTPEGSDLYLRLGTKGFSAFTDTKSVGAHKAYIRANALPAAKAGSDVAISIGSGLRTSLCANVDLDFSDQTDIKAYIATGYDGTIWLTRVMNASAGTPLYITGPEGEHTIKSVATQAVYANMMVGNNTEETITIQPTDGEYTNLRVGTKGFSRFTGEKTVSAHKSYLQILTSYIPASVRGNVDDILLGVSETETIKVVFGNIEDETTAIRSLESELTDDVWYNLKGQRIDTPTKKGLYIKNGKKVIFK